MSLKNFMKNVFGGKEAKEEKSNAVSVKAPINGKVLKLEEIKDPAFSSGMLGKGLAIDPEEGKVHSPVDGEIVMLFDTCHAVGIKSNEGVDLLIHIGMDTVELNGEGFKAHIKNGDKVKAGQDLIDFDLDLIKEKGYEVVTPIVVTNLEKIKPIQYTDKDRVVVGDEIFNFELQ